MPDFSSSFSSSLSPVERTIAPSSSVLQQTAPFATQLANPSSSTLSIHPSSLQSLSNYRHSLVEHSIVPFAGKTNKINAATNTTIEGQQAAINGLAMEATQRAAVNKPGGVVLPSSIVLQFQPGQTQHIVQPVIITQQQQASMAGSIGGPIIINADNQHSKHAIGSTTSVGQRAMKARVSNALPQAAAPLRVPGLLLPGESGYTQQQQLIQQSELDHQEIIRQTIKQQFNSIMATQSALGTAVPHSETYQIGAPAAEGQRGVAAVEIIGNKQTTATDTGVDKGAVGRAPYFANTDIYNNRTAMGDTGINDKFSLAALRGKEPSMKSLISHEHAYATAEGTAEEKKQPVGGRPVAARQSLGHTAKARVSPRALTVTEAPELQQYKPVQQAPMRHAAPQSDLLTHTNPSTGVVVNPPIVLPGQLVENSVNSAALVASVTAAMRKQEKAANNKKILANNFTGPAMASLTGGLAGQVQAGRRHSVEMNAPRALGHSASVAAVAAPAAAARPSTAGPARTLGASSSAASLKKLQPQRTRDQFLRLSMEERQALRLQERANKAKARADRDAQEKANLKAYKEARDRLRQLALSTMPNTARTAARLAQDEAIKAAAIHEQLKPQLRPQQTQAKTRVDEQKANDGRLERIQAAINEAVAMAPAGPMNNENTVKAAMAQAPVQTQAAPVKAAAAVPAQAKAAPSRSTDKYGLATAGRATRPDPTEIVAVFNQTQTTARTTSTAAALGFGKKHPAYKTAVNGPPSSTAGAGGPVVGRAIDSVKAKHAHSTFDSIFGRDEPTSRKPAGSETSRLSARSSAAAPSGNVSNISAVHGAETSRTARGLGSL